MSASIPLADTFERALGEILARVSVSAGAPQTASIAIAFSGGLDSSVLLHLVHEHAQRHGIRLFAFHVHHGISPNADAWLVHCREQAAQIGVNFDVRKILLSNQERSGVEEAARIGRYAALGELCREHRVALLLTAHHQDDQAETVLLQLLRGSGVAGLSGMDAANTAPDLLGDETLAMGRPLLDVSRAALEEYAAQKRIAHVHDESNADPRYARNALRHQVMPALSGSFAGYQHRLVRTASHMQAAQRLLDVLAEQDWQQCRDGDCLDMDRLCLLDTDRCDNLLRYWLGLRGVRMPSSAWLSEMRAQILAAKEDAQVCVTHADGHVRRYRNRVYLTPRLPGDPATVQPASFRWQGEMQLSFPEYGGILHFDPVEEGVKGEWLQRQPLQLRYRQGGERLKPAANRSTRSLKHHYQALDIPAWERERLPLVFAGSELLFAAGVGMDCHHVGSGTVPRIRLRWEARP